MTKNCGLCVRVCVSVCVCVCPRHGAIVARRRSLEAYLESRRLIVPVDVPIDQKPTRAKTRTATSGHASSLHATPRENRCVPVTCCRCGQSAGFERDWTKTHHGAGIASSPTARRLSRWAAASISSPRAGCRGLGVGDDVLAGARPLRSRSRTEEGAAACRLKPWRLSVAQLSSRQMERRCDAK